MAMIKYPNTQRKAQEEIDALTGRTRLPAASDRPHLPYTEALYTELMRWMPPIPLSEFISVICQVLGTIHSRSLARTPARDDLGGSTFAQGLHADSQYLVRIRSRHEECGL